MNPRVPRDLVASVRGRLEQAARRRREDFQVTLLRYGIERLLYRLARSPHRSRFVLKGAMLFEVRGAHAHRATRDLDLLGTGAVDEPWLRDMMGQLCRVEVEPDGLHFDPGSVRLSTIHDEQAYEGWHVSLEAILGTARVPLQIDFVFGQAVDPPAEEVEYPGLLDLPRAILLAYPREVAVAERFEAIVALGIPNSRMKDFFDIAFLADTFDFKAERLVAALRATFGRRQAGLPEASPPGLTAEYFGDPDRLRDWSAFTRRAGVAAHAPTLAQACARIEALIMPAVDWARMGTVPARVWRSDRGWGVE